jgi:CHAT domain-containing protein
MMRAAAWLLLGGLAGAAAGPCAAEEDHPFRSAAEAPALGRIDSQLVHGEYETALAEARECLRRAESAGDRRSAGWAVHLEGNALFYLNRMPDALVAFERAGEMLAAEGERLGEGLALKDTGIVLKYLGSYDRAVPLLFRARERFRELGQKPDEASAVENLGLAYEALGLRARALDMFREAVALAMSDPLVRAGLLCRLSGLAQDPQNALALARQSAELAREGGRPFEERVAIGFEIDALFELGRPEEAEEAASAAIALSRRLKDAMGEARVLAQVGRRMLDRNPARAETLFRDAERLSRQATWFDRWFHLAGLGAALRRLGQRDAALELLGRAEDRVTKARASSSRVEGGGSLSRSTRFCRDELLAALLPADDTPAPRSDAERAFAVLERSRAAEPRKVPAEELVESVRSGLPPAAAILTWAVGSDQVIAFALSRDELVAKRLEIAPDVLRVRVANLVDLVSRGADAEAFGVGRRVHDDLLTPLLSELPRSLMRLVLVPDGILHHLPFEALPLQDGRPLDEVFAVSRSLRAESSKVGRPPSGEAFLVVADPPLSTAMPGLEASPRKLYEERGFPLRRLAFAGVEARRVAEHAVRAEVLVGARATESRVKNLPLATFRVLHFATHGLLDERNPGLSALVLGPGDGEDGFLQAREIESLRLDSDLVVLSGCRTARGSHLEGEGPLGLARGFLVAGARSVVASLWDVDDAATARLMDAFYDSLAAGLSKAEALRRARREIRGVQATSSARYWAPFVIIGDGEGVVPGTRSSGRPSRALGAAAVAAAILGGWGFLRLVGTRRRRSRLPEPRA